MDSESEVKSETIPKPVFDPELDPVFDPKLVQGFSSMDSNRSRDGRFDPKLFSTRVRIASTKLLLSSLLLLLFTLLLFSLFMLFLL
jgi:hypothetical protein